MKRNPIRSLGVVFAAVAGVELAALLVLAAVVRQREALLVLTLVLGLQALIFGGVGGGCLLYLRKRRLLRERLLADGYREMADVIGTELQVNVRVNGRYPYRLVCRIERDGVLHEYHSDLLPVNPGLPPGSRVPVYLDRYDPHKYYVDVDSVMPTIVQH